MLPSLAGLAPASKVSVGSAKAHDSFAQTLRRAAPLLSPTKVQVLVGGHDETRPRNSLGRSPDSRFEDGTVVGRGSASRGIRHTLLRRYYVSYGVRTRIALLGQAAHSRIAGWLTLPRSPTLCLSRANWCNSIQPRPGAEPFCSALTSRCSSFRVPSWPTRPGGAGLAGWPFISGLPVAAPLSRSALVRNSVPAQPCSSGSSEDPSDAISPKGGLQKQCEPSPPISPLSSFHSAILRFSF